MSGIYGIYRYDGAPVDPQWMERMHRAMAYYGPHGGNSKIEGSLGMGFLLLEVNPEDAFENQPIRGERGLVLCSARLDNRNELLNTLGVPASEAPGIADGHLVSLAFDRWGDDVCTHLEGDWALVAWDAKQRKLLMARDILGSAGLYYYEGNGFVAFASSMKALLALPEIEKKPDFLHLAEVLAAWPHDAELTAYEDFRSVVMAHVVIVDYRGQTQIRRFWSPGYREPLRYRREEQYVEEFLDHYVRAVKSCLRTQKPIASELSGGRDSGSVVTLAAPLLASEGRELTAYTSVPLVASDNVSSYHIGNEWESAHATATMAGPNVRHVPVDSKDYGVLKSFEYILDVHDAPSFAASNLFWIQALLETCRHNGAGALLSGQNGNATVSWAGNCSAVLALSKRQPEAALNLLLQGEPNLWLTLKRQILKPLITPGLRLLRRVKKPREHWKDFAAINEHMARELDIEGRILAAGYDPSFGISPLTDLQRLLLLPDLAAAGSARSNESAWHSLAYLDPTANLSMIEFLLRVPEDQFYRKGESSYLMKRAFKNRLPKQVLYPEKRGLQGADLGHRILRELPAFQECVDSFESVPAAKEILDLPLLKRCLNQLTGRVDEESTLNAMTILSGGVGVGLFLRRLANNPY